MRARAAPFDDLKAVSRPFAYAVRVLIFVLAFLGGVLTTLSPCILPVLPFVFALADRPFRRHGLPLLAGMVVTFTLVASLASFGGGWVVRANQAGRIAALLLLALFALSLLSERVAEFISRPLVRLGNRLANGSRGEEVSSSFVLGIATGLLWAPCAGPILGLILTGAALGGASTTTSLLLFAYGLGAASSLAVALFAGQRVFQQLKRSLGVEVWIRRLLGIASLAAVAAIAFGLDRGLLTSSSLSSNTALEQKLVDTLHPLSPGAKSGPESKETRLSDEGPAPDLTGATLWLNSPPLSSQSLRGKVVLIDFWTYSCINCLRTLPYVRAWDAKYRSRGLVTIGVHTPEFAFEKEAANVRQALGELGITYPVALDDSYAIWNAFHNEYWPAHYFIDIHGRIRHHHFGEGGYEEAEHLIQGLLRERNGSSTMDTATVRVEAEGAQAQADDSDVETPETYLGSGRAQGFSSPESVAPNVPRAYTQPARLALNAWALTGLWTVGEEQITLDKEPGSVVLRFHARDAHIVLGTNAPGKSVRFQILLDGNPPGTDAGVDVDARGFGTVREHRLYQIVRQKRAIVDRTLEIRFLDPGVTGYSFTFG